MKYVPYRICCVCHKKQPKSDLIRIVRTSEGFRLDPLGNADGRGAYVCKSKECLTKCAKKHLLNRSLKTAVPEEIYAELETFYNED